MRSSKGQSILEWLFIAILVITGVIVAGPYVLNSIRAHYKLWDDSIQDSAYDRLIQTNEVDFYEDCTCTLAPGLCADKGCTLTERAMKQICSPVGCRLGWTCQPDLSCCEAPERGECWRASTVIPSDKVIPSPPPGYHMPCGLGDRVFRFKCGDSIGMMACQQDHNGPSIDGDRDCRPICDETSFPTGTAVDGQPIATKCSGTGSSLFDDHVYHFWNLPAQCSADQTDRCEGICHDPLWKPSTTGSGCQIDCTQLANLYDPQCPLSCSLSTNHPAEMVVVPGEAGPARAFGLTTFNCPVDHYVVGYCVKYIDRSVTCGYDNYGRGVWCYGQSTVSGNRDHVRLDVYCLPCDLTSCAGGCTQGNFSAAMVGRGTALNRVFSVNSHLVPQTCNLCGATPVNCDPGETVLNCPADCGCGNGVINPGEQCDLGTALNGQPPDTSDTTQPFWQSCSSTCQTVITPNPLACGDRNITPGEQCDNGNLTLVPPGTNGVPCTFAIDECDTVCEYCGTDCRKTLNASPACPGGGGGGNDE